MKWPHPSLMSSIFIALILTLLSKNAPGGCLIVNKLSTYITIIHSLSFFYCMLHLFLSLYLQNVVSRKELPFIWGGWDALESYHLFFATIICQGSSPGFGIFSFTSFTDCFPRLPSRN